jgi:antitoxin VapB
MGALYINDDEVNDLAEKIRAATGSRNKTEAVRQAFLNELARLAERKTLTQRLSGIRARAREEGYEPDGRDVSSVRAEYGGAF